MKSLKEIFERIAYAGMKPGAPAAQKSSLRWLGPLEGPVERFLNGPASSDPFYLTNRTLGQRVRMGILISIPFVVVVVLVGLAASGKFNKARVLPPESKQLSNAEIAARMLPDLNKDLNIETNRELQVANVIVGAGRISGTLKNNTDRLILDAEVVFDLANAGGSRVGAVNIRVPRVEPHASAPFSDAVPQHDAAYAIVREVHNQ